MRNKKGKLFFILVVLFFVFLTLFSENFHNHSALEKHDSDCIVYIFSNLFFLISSVSIFVLFFQLMKKSFKSYSTDVKKNYYIFDFYPKRAPPII